MAGAEEHIGSTSLLRDEAFLGRLGGPNGIVRLVGEVKGGDVRSSRQIGKVRAHLGQVLEYTNKMFGQESEEVFKLLFCKDEKCFRANGGITRISISHCLWWVSHRLIDTQRLTEGTPRSKRGSWVWSEEFLSDLLYNLNLGVYQIEQHQCTAEAIEQTSIDLSI
jgi:hypothetical protein